MININNFTKKEKKSKLRKRIKKLNYKRQETVNLQTYCIRISVNHNKFCMKTKNLHRRFIIKFYAKQLQRK